MSIRRKLLELPVSSLALTGALLVAGPVYAQDFGDMGFSLDLNAASEDNSSSGDGGFSLDLNAAPADNSAPAADDGGFAINLDGGSDGGFTIDFGGDVDFGDMTFDFGSGDDNDAMDFGSLDMSAISEMKSEEKEHYEEALKLARNERWEQAAAKFAFILSDEAHKEFWLESEFQLAKALYKMELYHPAMERFKVILNKGPKHPRFKTSVEFVFYISRKMVDQNEVLQELAKFRKIPWPKQYRNEYRLLLAKYLFLQAQVFEQNRIKEEEQAARMKKAEKHFNFKEFEEDNNDDDGWGETFVFGGDDEDEEMEFDMGEISLQEDFTIDFEDENEMKAETAPLPTTAADAIALALEMLGQISEKSRFSPQARYLEGLLHYLGANGQKNESLDKSVKAFSRVTKALDPKTAKITDPVLREAAFLTLARIYYEFQRFDVSVYYYDKIDRDSEMWLTALFESSWAYFQRGDFEKALGNLATLHSPFFKEEYFPESQNLKAVIYLENCRYPETRKIANDFATEMKPVLNHLKPYVKEVKDKDGNLVQPPTPDKLYEQIDKMLSSKKRRNGDELTMKVMRLVTMDPDVALSREKVAEIDKQLLLLEKRSNDFKQSVAYTQLSEELKTMRTNRVMEGGKLLAARFDEEISTLSGLISQAIQIRKQVVSSLKEIKVKQMQGEDVGVTQRPYEASVAVDDEYLYWPYEEEYWRDELGTYEYTLSWGCK